MYIFIKLDEYTILSKYNKDIENGTVNEKSDIMEF